MSQSLGRQSLGRQPLAAGVASWLFVPGDRPERFEKAVASGAHQVVVDLEDAVPGAAKDAARAAAVSWLRSGGSAWVRIGAAGDASHADDVRALRALSQEPGTGLRGVMLPKATPLAVATLEADLGYGVPLVALVETAAGIRDVHDTVANPAVAALALGTIDLAVDLGAERTWDALLHARSTLVVAARAGGLPGPIDGPSTSVRDPRQAGEEAAAVRAFGFAGKLCIHPAQVPAVHDAFAPTPAETAWAERVAAAVGGTEVLVGAGPDKDHDGTDLAMAVQVDGEMVDRPVLLRARRILLAGPAAREAHPSHDTTD